MKRISIWWYVALITWLLIGIGFMFLNKQSNLITIEDTNLLLGIISVAISIVSVAIATMKLPKFKGKVECWHVRKELINKNNSNNGTDPGQYNCILFKVNNHEKTPINNLIVNFRIPKPIIYNHYSSKELKFRESRDTVIATFDNLRFLGNSGGDSDVVIKHLFNLDKWKKKEFSSRIIYVTVAGDNIIPTTFKLKSEKIEELLDSSEKHNKKIKLE